MLLKSTHSQVLMDREHVLVLTSEGREQLFRRDRVHDCMYDDHGHVYRLDGPRPVHIERDQVPDRHWTSSRFIH